MVMKTKRSFTLIKTLVLALAALYGFASSASAQSAIRGEFTLPSEIVWGQAVLPAGDYSFNLPSTRAPEIIQIRGEGKSVLIMAQATSDLPASSDSALVLVRNGDRSVVSSLRLAPLGITLHYAAHKGAYAAVAQAPVPVRVAAK